MCSLGILALKQHSKYLTSMLLVSSILSNCEVIENRLEDVWRLYANAMLIIPGSWVTTDSGIWWGLGGCRIANASITLKDNRMYACGANLQDGSYTLAPSALLLARK